MRYYWHMDEASIAQARNTLWDYLQLHTEFPDEVDVIIVIGSRDDRVASFAADMSHRAASQLIVVTGGSIHRHDWLPAPDWAEDTEAEHFTAIMKRERFSGNLALETKAANIGEKITLTEKILREKDLEPKSVLIISALYMERRVLKTFQRYWKYGSPKVYITSTRETFSEYVDSVQTADIVTHVMVGEMDRILKYPRHGYMEESAAPEFVIDAYELLKHAGYDKLLL
jgi:hypothetical protein